MSILRNKWRNYGTFIYTWFKSYRKGNSKKERRLPLKGEVLVKVGDLVKADDIVARTELPGDVERLNLAGNLEFLQKRRVHF